MSKQAAIKLKGTITDSARNSVYIVELDNGIEITCHISGKIRLNNIRLTTGDHVEIECSPYDLSKGRIVKRLWIYE